MADDFGLIEKIYRACFFSREQQHRIIAIPHLGTSAAGDYQHSKWHYSLNSTPTSAPRARCALTIVLILSIYPSKSGCKAVNINQFTVLLAVTLRTRDYCARLASHIRAKHLLLRCLASCNSPGLVPAISLGWHFGQAVTWL